MKLYTINMIPWQAGTDDWGKLNNKHRMVTPHGAYHIYHVAGDLAPWKFKMPSDEKTYSRLTLEACKRDAEAHYLARAESYLNFVRDDTPVESPPFGQ